MKRLETAKDKLEKCLNRIDEIENAVFECIKVVLKDYNLPWNYELIGDISDAICDILVSKGYKVRYPSIVVNEDGSETFVEFHSS